MNSKQYKNNKGFTLIELIATIAILTMVIGVSSGLMIQLIRTDTKTTEQISLSQETNVLINELRSQYESGDNFPLKFAEGKLVFPESSKDYSLMIEKLEITNGEDVLNTKGKEITVNTDLPLSINLTTTNKDSKPFTLKTKWENLKDHEFTISINSEGNTCNGFEGGSEFDSLDFNIIDIKDISITTNDYVVADTDKCEFVGNTKFTKDFKEWNQCEEIRVRNGSAWFEKKIELKDEKKALKMNIAEDLFLKEGLEVKKGESINIVTGGHLISDNKIEFEENNVVELNISKSLHAKEVKIEKNNTINLKTGGDLMTLEKVEIEENGAATLDVTGHLIAGDEIEIEKNGIVKLDIKKSLQTKDVEFEKNNTIDLKIGGDLVALKEIEIEKNGSVRIDATGHLIADDEIEIEENSDFVLNIGGSLKAKESEIEKNGPTLIIIGGSADFGKAEFKKNNDFTLTAGTSVKFKEIKLDFDDKVKNPPQLNIYTGKSDPPYGNCVVFINSDLKLEKKQPLNIFGNILFKKEVKLEDESKLTIKGDALFEDEVKLEDKSKLIIEGDAEFKKKIETKKRACITVNGNIVTKNKKDGQKINQCSD